MHTLVEYIQRIVRIHVLSCRCQDVRSVPIRELRANTEMCGELFVCDKGLLVFKNI